MKKLTSKQIVLIVLMAVCTALFLLCSVKMIEGICTIMNSPDPFNHPVEQRHIAIFISFIITYSFIFYLAIKSFKNRKINKIPFSFFIIIGSLSFFISFWFLSDNLINITIPILTEHPETRNVMTNLIISIIFFQFSIAILYGLFLWLSISTVIQRPASNLDN